MSRLGEMHFTKHTGEKQSATLIFFHGSGNTGMQLKQWVDVLAENFSFPHIKILYPTAPLQPYTIAGGLLSNVWFDRKDLFPNTPEQLESLKKIEVDVKELIELETATGIAPDRIIVGGFSMGGALALHTAYRWETDLAGVFAVSSFLNTNSIVYQELKIFDNVSVPLLQIHGRNDDLVELSQGQNTFRALEELGVPGEFHIIENLGHTLNKRALEIVKEWVELMLPEI